MSTAVVILILFSALALYGVLLFGTSYIKCAAYIKGLMLNGLLFWFGQLNADFNYPSVFKNRWLNLAFVSVLLCLAVFLLQRIKKVRTTLFFTLGTLTALAGFDMVLRYSGDFPEKLRVPYVMFGVFVSMILQAVAIVIKKFDEPAGFYNRIFACIALMPAPFFVSMAVICSGYGAFVWTRRDAVISLLVTLCITLVYFIYISVSDFRIKRKNEYDAEREQARQEVRSKISSLVGMQMERIENSMTAIRSFSDSLPSALRSRAKALYIEAKQIEAAYSGTASGDILKRLTEIKDELGRLKQKAASAANSRANFGTKPNTDADSNSNSNENSGRNKNAGSDIQVNEQDVIPAFFNGCNGEDELKKRYHQLCKVFHPDSGSGDEETFMRIREEYDRLVKLEKSK